MTSISFPNVTVHEDNIDNDMLIEIIEKRPALFDRNLKEYSDINLKNKLWEEIYRTIFSNVWCNLSSQDKTEAGKLVQKRWKNLRACFSRELREQKSIKSGQPAKRRRKYRYFDQLLFLVPSMDLNRETSGNADAVEEINDEQGGKDAGEDVLKRKEITKMRKSTKIPYEDRIINILNKPKVEDNKFIEAIKNNKSNSDDDDREKHFALSLVPLLKAVPEENKLEVQIRILKIFQDVQKQHSYSLEFSDEPQEQVSCRTSTQRIYSTNYIDSQNFQIKPEYSVTPPPSSPQSQVIGGWKTEG